MLGISAGAHLAALLGTQPEEQVPDGVSSRVQAVVSFYGPSDLARLMVARRLFYEPVRMFIGDGPSRSAHLVAEASPTSFTPISRAQVLGGKCWTVPTLANGRIYCRNAKGDLVCLDVKGT